MKKVILPSLVLSLSCMLSACAVKTPTAATQRPVIEAVRWKVDDAEMPFYLDSDVEEIAVVERISYYQHAKAFRMLESRGFVRVTNAKAEELMGHAFSARSAILKQAEDHAERAAMFAKLWHDDPKDGDWRDFGAEEQATARRLRSQSGRLKPYLMRAIGLAGCGTGGFGALRHHDEIWVSFGGLGSGYTPETQAVIVYLDRPPRVAHVTNPGTCL
ncbi:MAG: hypothetical protein K9N47_19710 [Prosthecobacter sp.]|uniref:hypothetical protein n=1 Tax=Prosthecobacter sp. TaxID=1965333 RepID=UPI0025E6A9C3|nr:hypothetical protein [Prosthecobacter sp.]MCF7788358.1 hypothetical protein [Prosthecobacter sp.]